MSEILHGLVKGVDFITPLLPGGWAASPFLKAEAVLADVMAPSNSSLSSPSQKRRDMEDLVKSVHNIVRLTPLGGVTEPAFHMLEDVYGKPARQGGDTKPPWLHRGEVKKPKPASGSTKPSYTPKPTSYTPKPRPVYTPRTTYTRRRDADNRGNCHRNRTDNKPWNPYPKNMFGFDPAGIGKWFSDMLQGFFGPIAAETQSVLMAIIPIALIAIIAIIILKKAVF